MIRNIGIVGHGTVGKKVETFFKNHHFCVAYDAFIEGIEERNRIFGADVAIICVSTPAEYVGLMPGNVDYRCDISGIDDCICWCTAPLIIIKSTVPPGTTDYLKQKYGKRIVYSPTFCDDHDSDYFIFGGDLDDTKEAVELFQTVGGAKKKYIQTTAKAAEMVKYVSNAYQINKMAFCQDIASLCKKTNIDYNEVRELWLNDTRVDPQQTLVTDHLNAIMKKDSKAFVEYAKQLGLDLDKSK